MPVVEPNGANRPHVPPPSLWPVGFAVGIALLLTGLLIGWLIVALGAALTAIFRFLWVRELAGAPPALRTPEPGPVRGVAAAPVPDVGGTRVGEAALPLATQEEVDRYPRKKFLELSTLGLGGLIGGLVTAPVAGFAIAPAFLGGDADEEVDIGALELYPEGEWRIATFMEDPEEGEVSRRTAFVRNNGPLDGVPSFTIVSNRCVHLGCPTQPAGALDEDQLRDVKTTNTIVRVVPTQPSAFTCPCHGGAYDTEGNRTAGPPVRALDRYEFSIRNGRLFLGKTYSVGEVHGEGKEALIEKYRLMYPGEHVDGLQQYLYPIPAP